MIEHELFVGERFVFGLAVVLDGREFICGDFSMIDVAAIGSTVPYRLHGVADLSVYPNLSRWYDRVRARPGVERGLAVGRDAGAILPDFYREALFDERDER